MENLLKKAPIFMALFACASPLFPVFANATVDNIENFQVIQRTSETYANINVKGTHSLSLGSIIQVRIARQGTTKVLAGFAWVSVDTISTPKTWKGLIANAPVGGEYSLTFRYTDAKNNVKDTIKTIDHVLVGDVWGAAGQSNMLGMGFGGSADSAIDQVHVLTFGASWKKAQEPLGSAGVGPALRFAMQIYKAKGVPIGLAYYAKGGTGMDYWSKGAEGFEKWTSVITNAGGSLYGVIWYQGERNMAGSSDEVTNYKALTTTFMKDIRRYVNNATLPWILAQIATIGDSIINSHAMIVRESQRSISAEDPCAETITTIDVPRVDSYHFDIPRYQIIGNRFANAALHKAYGEKEKQNGPLFANAHFSDNGQTRVVVGFQGLLGTLSPEAGINGFYVNVKGEIKYPLSTIKYTDSTIILYFESALPSDAALGYAYGYNPVHLNLTDSSKISAQPFYNQPIFSYNDPEGKNARYQPENGATSIDVPLELKVVENPLGLYSLMLISFPEVKSLSAKLSIFSIAGICVRNIKLIQGQDRCAISRRFLPGGCYVLRMQDGISSGTKRFFWKFGSGK